MSIPANDQPITIERCDHLKKNQELQRYNIAVQLGDNRILELCVQCGKAFQADILASIMERSIKAHMAQQLRRSLGV